MTNSTYRVFIFPTDKESQRFFNKEGLKKLNKFLKENAPQVLALDKIHEVYGTKPVNDEKMAKLRVKKNAPPTEVLEVQVYTDIKLSENFDFAFEYKQPNYENYRKVMSPGEEKDIPILKFLHTFFTENKVNYELRAMPDLK